MTVADQSIAAPASMVQICRSGFSRFGQDSACLEHNYTDLASLTPLPADVEHHSKLQSIFCKTFLILSGRKRKWPSDVTL